MLFMLLLVGKKACLPWLAEHHQLSSLDLVALKLKSPHERNLAGSEKVEYGIIFNL